MGEKASRAMKREPPSNHQRPGEGEGEGKVASGSPMRSKEAASVTRDID